MADEEKKSKDEKEGKKEVEDNVILEKVDALTSGINKLLDKLGNDDKKDDESNIPKIPKKIVVEETNEDEKEKEEEKKEEEKKPSLLRRIFIG